MGVEVPPREAVSDKEHQTVLVQQGANALGDDREDRGLHRDDDDVLRLEIAGLVGDDRMRHQCSLTGFDPEPVLSDRVELWTALDHRDLGLARGEPPGDVTAHGARPVHANLHGCSLRSHVSHQANCARFWAAAALRNEMSLPVET